VRGLPCPNRQGQKRTNVADKKVDEDGNVYISPQIWGFQRSRKKNIWLDELCSMHPGNNLSPGKW
jgi:hypothetical protein